MFMLLKERLNLMIRIFKCDFETGLINAIKDIFPSAEIRGCYYHFNRAVWK